MKGLHFYDCIMREGTWMRWYDVRAVHYFVALGKVPVETFLNGCLCTMDCSKRPLWKVVVDSFFLIIGLGSNNTSFLLECLHLCTLQIETPSNLCHCIVSCKIDIRGYLNVFLRVHSGINKSPYESVFIK